MINWKSLDSDLIIPEVNDLFKQNSVLFVLDLVRNSLNQPQIFISKTCFKLIHEYLSTSNLELGGLLIGKTYSIPYESAHSYNFITFINYHLPSNDFDNSSVSLRIKPEIWDRARVLTEKGELILGWFHSHPNLGAFFSGIDKHTQKHFFHNNYSLGLVIDPIRDEYKMYFGGKSEKIESELRFIDLDKNDS